MDKIIFDPLTHTYTNVTKNFVYEWSGSRIASVISGHDLSKVNSVLLEKSAEHGTEEHKQLEVCIVTEGAIHDSDICNWFLKYFYDDYKNWEAEKIIYTEDLPVNYAGKLDAIAVKNGRYTIFDLKTGRRDMRYWQAQLTAYMVAVCQMYNINREEVDLMVLHCNGGEFKAVPIKPLEYNEFIGWLQSIADGTEHVPVKCNDAEEIMLYMERCLEAQMELQSKLDIEESKLKEWKTKLLNLMNDKGILTLETEHYKFTPVAPTESTGLDTDTIKKDKELWESLPKKITKKSGYLKVTEKK